MLLAIQLKHMISYPVPSSKVILKKAFLDIFFTNYLTCILLPADIGSFDCCLMPGDVLL